MLPLKSLLINIYILLILVLSGYSKPTQRTSKTLAQALAVNPESLTPGTINICEDFVHVHDKDGNDNSSSAYKGHAIPSNDIIHDLLIEDWKRAIGKQFRRFTKKHVPCKQTLKMLKKQKIENYFAINHRASENTTPLAKVYIQVSRLSLILAVLKSDAAKQCCLQDKQLTGLYVKLKNRNVANLYHTVAQEMSQWTAKECYMRVAMVTNEPMRCEDVTHVIAIVLKDAVKSSKRLRSSMKRIQKDFQKKLDI